MAAVIAAACCRLDLSIRQIIDSSRDALYRLRHLGVYRLCSECGRHLSCLAPLVAAGICLRLAGVWAIIFKPVPNRFCRSICGYPHCLAIVKGHNPTIDAIEECPSCFTGGINRRRPDSGAGIRSACLRTGIGCLSKPISGVGPLSQAGPHVQSIRLHRSAAGAVAGHRRANDALYYRALDAPHSSRICVCIKDWING